MFLTANFPSIQSRRHANFLCLYVHSVEDSTLILIFDPFCLFLFLKGSPKFSPNRYTDYIDYCW